MPDLHESPSALTTLSDEERLVYDGVYEFADKEIRPLVRQMDEEAQIPRSLLDRLFELNVMGIEIPEPDGGAGGTFFHSVLAVEALSRVDPSIGVLVDVQNTLVVNAAASLGQRGAEADMASPPRAEERRRVCVVGSRDPAAMRSR